MARVTFYFLNASFLLVYNIVYTNLLMLRITLDLLFLNTLHVIEQAARQSHLSMNVLLTIALHNHGRVLLLTYKKHPR